MIASSVSQRAGQRDLPVDCPPKPWAWRVARGLVQGLPLLALLAACSWLPTHPVAPPARSEGPHPAPGPQGRGPGSAQPGHAGPAAHPELQPDGSVVWDRGRARWVQVDWDELPGWALDRPSEAWVALWRSCQRPATGWEALCTRARLLGASWGQDTPDDTVRRWLQAHVQPWRIETPEGQGTGLLTGYFEPLIDARRQPQGAFQTPLFRPPADLAQRRPHYTRAEIDTLPEARAALAGRELVYLADPLDALLVQVQGSARVRLLDEPDAQGQPKVVRLAFAGHNDQPYQSVARWLVDQGAFPLEAASWQAIKGWASMNPQRVPEMLRANPRMVYFKEEVLNRPDLGPAGAQGVPLTPGRSIAIDKDLLPYGSLVWLDSTEPQAWSATPPPSRPLQRLVVAQDTGGAITGAVRADYFWGWGDEALAQAGRTKQPLRMWVLWPRS